MMLFIFAAKEQKDPVKPSSDEVTEACLVSPLNLAVPVIRGAVNLLEAGAGDGQNCCVHPLNPRSPFCTDMWGRESTDKGEN